MANKTILFGMPKVSGLYKLIDKNLRHCGFNVINLVEYADEFSYPSLTDYLYVKFRKLFYRDNYAKKQLMWQTLQPQIAAAIEACGGVDHALFISGDIYSREFLQFVRGESRNGLVNYQFDGLHRFPAIYPLIKEFDRFYVFDPDDLKKSDYPLLPATNFYFDNNLENMPERTLDFYFTGVHMDSRAEVIARFGRYVKERKKTADINILWKRNGDGRKTYPDDSITIIDKIIDFEENINRARQARVLIDFVIDEHKGLSFRTFEALGYQQKLITTNPQVKYYDFYHPNNFLIWDGYDFAALDDFLEKPYVQIDESIRKKYSFGNWINYILKINPYQEINLPN